MHLFRASWVCVLVAWVTTTITASGIAAESSAGQFVVIGDFHFDPFDSLTPQQFQTLAASPLEAWPGLLAAQPAAAYGRDSPFSLLRSSLDDVRARIPDPDFVLCPGDFLAHGWQPKYDKLAAKTRLQDPEAFRAFTDKVIRFMAGLIAERYSQVAFRPVLGNDDSYCGDYKVAPDSPFQSMFAETFEPLLGIAPDSDEAREFRASCARGGYYTLRLPPSKRHRLIALNTVYFSTLYSNDCGSATATPALDQFQWLERTLEAAQPAGERVWLLMHVPPGIDGYSTNRARGSGVAYWQPELIAKFLQLVRRHRSTIQMAFAGHTHMDDFRVISLEDEPVLLTKIVPAISPIFGNNPGYQVFRFDRESGTIADFQTIHLPLPGTGQAPSALWTAEYEFAQAYQLSPLNAATVVQLAKEIGMGGAAQKQYLYYYSVSAAPTGIALPILRCAILNSTLGEFNACVQGPSGAVP
ncbi:MAG: hypothetical protein EXS05_16095 [Planctomycetaceae bacterium]|nr:hypothetical protein [Planctomycetaceae bacterium]